MKPGETAPIIHSRNAVMDATATSLSILEELRRNNSITVQGLIAASIAYQRLAQHHLDLMLAHGPGPRPPANVVPFRRAA